jgi:hypothetical protein
MYDLQTNTLRPAPPESCPTESVGAQSQRRVYGAPCATTICIGAAMKNLVGQHADRTVGHRKGALGGKDDPRKSKCCSDQCTANLKLRGLRDMNAPLSPAQTIAAPSQELEVLTPRRYYFLAKASNDTKLVERQAIFAEVAPRSAIDCCWRSMWSNYPGRRSATCFRVTSTRQASPARSGMS